MIADIRSLAAAALIAAPLCASAQSISAGPGGARVYDREVTVHAPEPIQVGRELEMNELRVEQLPVMFYLNHGTNGRAGPFALSEGASVGTKQNPYTLHMADYGQRFTLQPAANTNASFGPFTATNGAPVLLGNTLLTVVRLPPELTVSLSHPNRIAQTPAIGVAPLSHSVLQELYNLRAKYVALANRVDYDTADAELQGVPRVSSAVTGNRFSPVIRTSGRDKQNAYKGAELSAIAFLEKVYAQAFVVRPHAITDGLTFRFRLPAAGDYVLCATQRVKDPKAASATSLATVVWWTAFHFDGERPLVLALTAENAITWREIFSFEKKR